MLHREVQGEALTGETDGPAIEPRNHKSGMPMLLSEAEGNTEHGVLRQSCSDPARSETLCTSGSPLHRNWEISAVPGAQAPGGAVEQERPKAITLLFTSLRSRIRP